MAVINYASKSSPLVDERFKAMSYTQAAVNDLYGFDGVSTVNVYSIPTAEETDYKMEGTARFGEPDELGDSVQTLVMSQDRAFTFTIDRRNFEDTMMVKEAGKALRRQLDEVTIPGVDKYRLSKIVAGAGNTATGAISKANAYESFLTGVTTLLDNKAPLAGTFAFIGSNFYKQIRLDTSFIQASNISQDMLVRGQVGMVEGVPIIHVPKSYLPEGTEFVITNRIAVTAPFKIADYRVNDQPQGISGWLVEGRIYHDCFVLDNKKNVIYVHKSA